MTYTLQRYETATQFLSKMQPVLIAYEVKYGLMFGVALRLVGSPNSYGERSPYFAVVEDSSGIVCAGLMTPPFGIVVYAARADCHSAYRIMGKNLLAEKWDIATANGPVDTVVEFVQVWYDLTGISATVGIQERVFELRSVHHRPSAPGRMREATLADLELVSRWYTDFIQEALSGTERPDATAIRQRAEKAVRDGSVFLWDNGKPVSLAALSRKTVHGVAIGPVYTPPEYRGSGYASSCVAQLSQFILDQGYAFCTLFTDLANPTSNRIYAQIGYVPVCDYTLYRFAASN